MSLSAQDKIRVAVSIAGVEAVWEQLNRFIMQLDTERTGDEYVVMYDGSIAHDDGEWLTETELEEFVSWAERENA